MNNVRMAVNNARFRGKKFVCKLFVMLMVSFFSLCVGAAHAYAQDIGTITRNGSTQTYDNFANLVEDLDDYKGETMTVDMLCDWHAGKDEKQFDRRIHIPKDSTVTFNMHGHIFDRDNVYDNDWHVNGEMIYIEPGATLTINGHSTEEESQTVHDAVHVYYGLDQETTNNHFITVYGGCLSGGNSTGGTGGIYIDSGKDCILNDVTIAGCKAEDSTNPFVSHHDDGGGVIITESGTRLKLNNSTITGCLASGHGGGIYQINDNDVGIELDNSHIDGNWANGGGGGVNMDGEKLYIKGTNGSTISNNTCHGLGGGVWFWNDDCTLSGITLDGNSSGSSGGGVFLEEETYTLKDLTITNNKATKKGGGIYVGNDIVTIDNCTVTGNDKQGIYVEDHCDEEMCIKGATVIRDNNGGNLTIQDGTSFFTIDQNDGMDIHIGYADLPDDVDGYLVTANQTVDVSNQFTADNSDYVVAYSYNDRDQDDGRRLRYIKESDQSDDRGWQRINPPEVTLQTKEIHAYATGLLSPRLTAYAGGYMEEEGGSGTAYQMRTIFAHHTSSGDKDYRTYYTDGFFFDDPVIYNDHLATASYGLATTGAYLDNYDYDYKHAAARQFMADIGCPDQMIYVNDSNKSKPGTDTIGVTIASKVLQELDGKNPKDTEYTLIAIAVRGANYGDEWASNVTLGNGSERDGEAQGFSEAADQVMDALDYYIAHYGLMDKIKDGKVKFWVSGFSRAGATANITSKRIIETYCEQTDVSVATGNQVFAYPCEAAKGGTDKAEKLDDKTAYFCIHNLVNAGDLVPYVGPVDMGFKRYGVDHYIPGTYIGRKTRDEYLDQVKTVVAHADQASKESGITQSTNYVDNSHLSTKKTMDSEVTDSYKQYVARRQYMTEHLAMIDHTRLFNDYFYPYSTSADVPPFKKKGDFDGAMLEDYLPNLISFLLQQSNIDRHDYVEQTVFDSRTTETLQNFARAYFSADADTKHAFEDLVNCFDNIIDGLWDIAELVYHIDHWGDLYSDKDKQSIIDDLWKQADDAGCFNDLTSEQKDALKVHWFTLLAVGFDFAYGDWHLGKTVGIDAGAPTYPTGREWVNGSVGSWYAYWIADRMIYALTATNNIGFILDINHDMEVAIAWTRTYDRYYSEDPSTGGPAREVPIEYFASWVPDKTSSDTYSVEAPGAYVKEGDPSAAEPYRRLQATPVGEDPTYNQVRSTQRVLLEVGVIHDSASPADIDQGDGDVFGEAVYYDLYDISDGQNEKQLLANELYRGGVDLTVGADSAVSRLKIVARARSLGQKSDEATYYVVCGHQIKVDDGSGAQPTASYYAEGETLTLAARPSALRYFVGWTVELLDGSGATVEADIADALLGTEKSQANTSFVVPAEGAQYAEGKTYPEYYELVVSTVCGDRIRQIEPSSTEGDNPIVPVAGTAEEPQYLAGAATLTFAAAGKSWTAEDPYEISWLLNYEGRDYPASAGDAIYGKSTYTATIEVPADRDSSILFAPTADLKLSLPSEMEGHVASMSAERIDEDGGVTVTIVFNPTEDGLEPPVADDVLTFMGADDSAPSAPAQELGEFGYVHEGQTVALKAKAWDGYAFVHWVFDEDYCDPYVELVEGEDPTGKAIKVRIKESIPAGHSLRVYALYTPAITEVAAVVETPVGGQTMQMLPTDEEGKETLKFKLKDDWYVIHPDFIGTTEGIGTIRWSPEPLLASDSRKANYQTAYTASLLIVPRQEGGSSYVGIRKEGSDEYMRSPFTYPFVADLVATMNGETAAFDPQSKTLKFTFPKTAYVLKKVYQPEDVSGIPYGTEGDELRPYLPGTVSILLDNGTTRKISVDWPEIDRYDPLFPYPGGGHDWMASDTLELPEYVINPDQLSLNVYCYLHVLGPGYVGKVVSSLEEGVYLEDQEVTLSCETEGADIYWTFDPEATEYVDEVKKDKKWHHYDGTFVLSRDDAIETDFDEETYRRPVFHLKTIAFKDPKIASFTDPYTYTYTIDVPVPEGISRVYDGRPQVGVYGGHRFYRLEPISEGVAIDEDGDAVAMEPGTYQVKAKVRDEFRWEIVNPDTGETHSTAADQTITFTIIRDRWWVRYDANGPKDATVPRAHDFPVGEDAVLTDELPEAGSLFFKGWARDPDAAKPDYLPGDTLPYDENEHGVVLYALWALDPVERPAHVTFNANGLKDARVPGDVWLESGEALQLVGALAPLGGAHVFAGWSEDPTSTEPEYEAGKSYVFAHDVTLYAVWEAQQNMTLTFEDPLPDAASGIPEPIAIAATTTPYVSIPSEVPQKSGRAFIGWNTERDGSGQSYAPGSTFALTQDTTLWAQWKVAKGSWYVVFDANGGQQAPTPQIVPLDNDAVLTREKPKNGTLAFKGWATDPDAAEPAYQPGDTLPYDADKSYAVLYALWELAPVKRPIHIAFNANGVDGAELPEDVWLQSGAPLLFGAARAPLGAARAFKGWSEDPAATEPTYEEGDLHVFSGDTTLYAVWETVQTLTLTFSDPLSDPVTDLPNPITIVAAMSPYVRIPSQTPVKSGRVFTGWNSEPDGTGESYAPGSTFVLNEDTTLWAQWEVAQSSWFVVYNANGGQQAPGPQIVPVGEDAVLTDELPKNGALAFKGWATDPDAAEPAYQPGDTLPYDADESYVFLYALWELSPVPEPVHVTFDANGLEGTRVPADVWVERGGELTLQAAAAPLGGTHVFAGWSEDPAATEPHYHAGDTCHLDQDTTFYAIWEAQVTATLTFDDLSADPVTDMPEAISILATMSPYVRIPSQIPGKSGRVFTGWNTDPYGTGDSYAPGSTFALTEDVTLWAQWTVVQDSWYVVFDANGGQWAPSPQIVPVGEDAVLTDEEPRAGALAFKGWATDPDAAEPAYQSGDTLPYDAGKSVVMLFALWELDPPERPVHVTFDANGVRGAKLPDDVWLIYGGEMQIDGAAAPLGSARKFAGWSEDPAAIEPEYRAGETHAFSQDTTLYAVWEAQQTITLTFEDPLPDEASGIPEPIAIVDSMSPYVRIPRQTPVKSGRAFTGWNSEPDGTGESYAPGSTFVLNEDTTLWAQWEVAKSNWFVVFDANGGQQAPGPQIVPVGEDAVLTHELPHAGALAFKGWATDPDAAEPAYHPGGTLHYDADKSYVVLYALWDLSPVPEPVHVTFDANGLDGASLPADLWFERGTWAQLRAAVAPLGGEQVFAGWSEDPDATEPEYLAGESYLFEEDVRLYAVWRQQDSVTLTFEDPLPDAASGIPEPITILTSASPYVWIPSTVPQKSGRLFTGWNTEPDGSGTSYGPGSRMTLLASITLWAQWDVVQNSWYVVFDANGGQQAPGPQIVPVGEDAVLTDELPEAETMVFRGWATDERAAKPAYQPGDTLPYDAEKSVVVLFALWSLDPVERPIRVAFDANGLDGARLPADLWFERGTWAQLQAAVAPLGGEQVFAGWSEDPDATEPEYLAGESYLFEEDVRLYAVWRQQGSVTLTFEDPLEDPVTDMPEAITITATMSPYVRIPSQMPVKSGRVFTGWNTERDGSGQSYAPGSTFTLTEDATLWAQWAVAGESWYVVYNANGGTKAPVAQVIALGEDAVLTNEMPEAETMVFRGWATDERAAEPAYQPGDTLPYDAGKSVVVLFALWSLDPVERPIRVAFDANGGLPGSVPAPLSEPRATSFKLPEEKPSWDSQHLFLGWSKDSQATEATWKAGDQAAFDQDTTLYAIWSAQYKVIQGADSVWTKGGGTSLRFVADGNLSYFRQLKIDGVALGEGVTFSSGSTIADISAEVLDRLAIGEHSITFVYMDGEASARFFVQSAAPSGGDTPSGGWVPWIPWVPSGGWIPSGGETPSGGATPSGGETPSSGTAPSSSTVPSGGAVPSSTEVPSGGATPSSGAAASGGVTPSVVVTPSSEVTPSSDSARSGGRSPATGDSSTPVPWVSLMVLAGAAFVLAQRIRRS